MLESRARTKPPPPRMVCCSSARRAWPNSSRYFLIRARLVALRTAATNSQRAPMALKKDSDGTLVPGTNPAQLDTHSTVTASLASLAMRTCLLKP